MLADLGVRIGQRWDDPWWRRGSLLRRYGIELVLDVGANTGQYARKLRRLAGYTGHILSFEPVTAAYAELERRASRDPRWACVQLALGNEDGEAEISIGRSTDVSSLLAFRNWPDKAVSTAYAVGTESVRVARLDSLQEIEPDAGVMLKLDVQGYEAQVIAGARSALAKMAVLECEVAFEHLYEEQPSFRELVDLVDDHGFVPYSIATGNFNPRTSSLTYVDILFARPGDRPTGGSPHDARAIAARIRGGLGS